MVSVSSTVGAPTFGDRFDVRATLNSRALRDIAIISASKRKIYSNRDKVGEEPRLMTMRWKQHQDEPTTDDRHETRLP